MADPRFTLNIHVNDEVNPSSHRVPSSGDDFVSINVGSQASILVFNSEQVRKLRDAVNDAYFLLKTIELEKERVAVNRSWEDEDDLPDFSDEYAPCRCDDCLDSASIWGEEY